MIVLCWQSPFALVQRAETQFIRPLKPIKPRRTAIMPLFSGVFCWRGGFGVIEYQSRRNVLGQLGKMTLCNRLSAFESFPGQLGAVAQVAVLFYAGRADEFQNFELAKS
jgi:hypothetical protein